MICKQCGNEVAPDAKFCGVCGAPVEVAEPQYAQPAEQPQQYAQPVEQPQQYVQQPQYTQPQYNQPQYSQPQYSQPQYNQPQYSQPQYSQPQYNAAAEDPAQAALSKSVLIFGILGIAFGCTFYLSFLGIIFGAIALSKAKAYINAGYVLAGRAKIGRILGLVGLIAGIVLTVIFSIYIIVLIIATASYSSYYYY